MSVIELSQEILERLLMDAICAALTASRAVLRLYNEGDFGVILKSDATPLTQADQIAHTEIQRVLAKTRIPLFSEEGRQYEYEERKDWGLYWLVDPLDGTRDFIATTDEFTVNVSLILNERPVLGVIDVPVRKTLYFNVPNRGAWRFLGSDDLLNQIQRTEGGLNLESFLLKSQSLPLQGGVVRQRLRVVRSRLNMSNAMHPYFVRLREQHGDFDEEMAGSSLKFCLVAEGSVDLYPRLGKTHEWDTAAGQAIVEGAGMEVVDFTSFSSLRYNKESIENPPFVAKRKALKVPRVQ